MHCVNANATLSMPATEIYFSEKLAICLLNIYLYYCVCL